MGRFPAVQRVLRDVQDGLPWLQRAALLELRVCRTCSRLSPTRECRWCGTSKMFLRVIFRDPAVEALRYLGLPSWGQSLLTTMGESSWSSCRLRFCTQAHGHSLAYMVGLSDLRGRAGQPCVAATITVVQTICGLLIAAGLQGAL